jgi:hypothetical protein
VQHTTTDLNAIPHERSTEPAEIPGPADHPVQSDTSSSTTIIQEGVSPNQATSGPSTPSPSIKSLVLPQMQPQATTEGTSSSALPQEASSFLLQIGSTPPSFQGEATMPLPASTSPLEASSYNGGSLVIAQFQSGPRWPRTNPTSSLEASNQLPAPFQATSEPSSTSLPSLPLPNPAQEAEQQTR